MDTAKLIFRFLYKKKWWLIIFPLLACIISVVLTNDIKREYSSNTVIYTGVVSGYNLESSLSTGIDIAQSNNQMENFVNIIKSYTTLKNVSLKLFAQHMAYGDTILDTKYITAEHFKPVYDITPASIKKLIVHGDADSTYANLLKNDKNEYDNFLYGIFMWDYSYYGKKALEEIQVSRVRSSDMIELQYTNDDPNVVYYTLLMLNEEFIEQYKIIRDQEADGAISYFEKELHRIDSLIKFNEDEQKSFSVQKKVINYEEQTKQMAFLQSNYKVRYQETLLSLNSSKQLIDDMERRFGKSFNNIKNNEDFMRKLNTVSSLSNQLAISSIFQNPETLDTINGIPTNSANFALERELKNTETELMTHVDEYYKFSGQGEVVISRDIALQWLAATVAYETAKKDMDVLKDVEKDINDMYEEYSPIGVYLKQKERVLGFLEQEYLSALDNLNQAKLRKKNTQMSASNLKVITPPQLPLSAKPTKRIYIVLASAFGVLVFILCVFIISELMGTTLRDKDRTERITHGNVVSAMPGKKLGWYKKYYNDYLSIATRQLSNVILNKTRYQERNIVNIISFSPEIGKTAILSQLSTHWNNIGRKNRVINWKEAMNKIDREIMYPINYNDLLSFGTDRILLIEHQDMSSDIIQKEILQNAIINILVLDATRSWKDTDKYLYNSLIEQLETKSNSLCICLVNATKSVVEDFTDQLPPYNLFTNLSYDIYNLGGASIKGNKRK